MRKSEVGTLHQNESAFLSRDLVQKYAIRELLENWVVWRDSGDWERFRTVWHSDGRMMATWFQGTGDEFIRVSQEGWARGIRILHFLGGSSIEIVGNRAIAQTKMTISQRAMVDGVMCDVVCTGRFYDFIERREVNNQASPSGAWRIALRQPIYERDRLDPVESSSVVKLDDQILNEFPEGYRHLAYLQTRIGYAVKRDMPGLQGPVVDALYERGHAWLSGDPC